MLLNFLGRVGLGLGPVLEVGERLLFKWVRTTCPNGLVGIVGWRACCAGTLKSKNSTNPSRHSNGNNNPQPNHVSQPTLTRSPLIMRGVVITIPVTPTTRTTSHYHHNKNRNNHNRNPARSIPIPTTTINSSTLAYPIPISILVPIIVIGSLPHIPFWVTKTKAKCTSF